MGTVRVPFSTGILQQAEFSGEIAELETNNCLTVIFGDAIRNFIFQARSSGGERYPDTVEVMSSNLIVPTRH